MQLTTGSGQTHAVVVSTLMEAWQVIRSGLVANGTVKDVSNLCERCTSTKSCDCQILYGLPVGINKIAELSVLSDEMGAHDSTIRLLVDHPDQVHALEQFNRDRNVSRRWSLFVKVDGGQKYVIRNVGYSALCFDY